MALSEATVRQAKTTGKKYYLSDFDGLSLYVSPTGAKAWHFRYYWAGKQKEISLGTYPEVGLREARKLRDEARELLAKAINPRVHRKQKRHAIRLASENDFKTVYLQWFVHRKLELKAGRQSTLSQIERIFDNDVLPRLGVTSIFDIQRSDLLDVLTRIEARGALSIAEKVRTWFNQLFRFALVKISGLTVNPASDLDVVALPKPPVANNPFLRLTQLPNFLHKLRAYGGAATTQLGVRLLLLTGVRTGELRLATPDQFDLERGLWIIPPEVIKQLQEIMRKQRKRAQDIPPYLVPLSIQAIEIVRYLLAEMKPAQTYLLSHRSDFNKRISENTLNQALKRMGYDELLTGHGIRATISTALNEIGYPKIWVDAQLSHCDPNKVSAAYNHALHVEPRRHMMQDWADRLDLLEQGRVQEASKHLTIRFDGVPTVSGSEALIEKNTAVMNETANLPVTSFQRLSPVPQKATPASTPVVVISDVQRERMEILNIYEAPHNLSVVQFAKLAGKSKDQINREIKADKLLTLSIGNRGQRVPDWQLDPIKNQLTHLLIKKIDGRDSWQLYRALTQPCEQLNEQSPIDAVKTHNIQDVIGIVYDMISSESKFTPLDEILGGRANRVDRSIAHAVKGRTAVSKPYTPSKR